MNFIDKVAWVHVEQGRVLSTRSRGKDVYYLPGGKREHGESDEACLRREIHEELAVDIKAGSLRKPGVFEARAHGKPLPIRMACYDADYAGELRASAEVAEFVWLTYGDRERCAPVDRILFDLLRERGELR